MILLNWRLAVCTRRGFTRVESLAGSRSLPFRARYTVWRVPTRASYCFEPRLAAAAIGILNSCIALRIVAARPVDEVAYSPCFHHDVCSVAVVPSS